MSHEDASTPKAAAPIVAVSPTAIRREMDPRVSANRSSLKRMRTANSVKTTVNKAD